MYSNLCDDIHEYTEPSDLSVADQAIAAEVLVKWYTYEGVLKCALEYSRVASEQWRRSARDKQGVLPSAALLELLEYWADGCGGQALSQAVAAEILAEIYWSVGQEQHNIESYKEAASYWKKATEAWRGLYKAPIPVEQA